MRITEKELKYGISCLNWPEEFPYAPEVSVAARHDGEHLFIHYEVEEEAVRACCKADMDNAWEDSCVEFFFAPADDGLYYNVECTCNGKIYMMCGPDRQDRRRVTDEALKSIRRTCSLGTDAFGLVEKPVKWTVDLEIPASAFCFHDLDGFRGLVAKGNFYKCGNMLPRRHFLSMFPIDTPRPDFHRPEFFDTISFE